MQLTIVRKQIWDRMGALGLSSITKFQFYFLTLTNVFESWTTASIAKKHHSYCWGPCQLAQPLGGQLCIVFYSWIHAHIMTEQFHLEKSSWRKQWPEATLCYMATKKSQKNREWTVAKMSTKLDRTSHTAKKRTECPNTATEKKQKGNVLERMQHHVAVQ